MKLIHLKLVTPERTVLFHDVESLSCPTEMGQITVLADHQPLVATLRPGELSARGPQSEFFVNVTGGFLQVDAGSQVTVLADAAEHFYEINEERAEAARKRAQEMLQQEQLSDREYARVAASLEKNLTRLNILRKHSHRRTSPITGEGVRQE